MTTGKPQCLKQMGARLTTWNIIHNKDKNTDIYNGMNESVRNDAKQKKLDPTPKRTHYTVPFTQTSGVGCHTSRE